MALLMALTANCVNRYAHQMGQSLTKRSTPQPQYYTYRTTPQPL